MENIPVAGIDIGKYFSELAILSPSNKVYANMKINHCTEDFEKSLEMLRKAEKEFQAKPVVIMESTGHYFKLLFNFLKNAGYEVIAINPLQTNSIKNINIRKVKNDKVDARKIALLYRFEGIKGSTTPNDNINNLRHLCRQYYDLVDIRTSYKNKLISVMDQVMLTFRDLFDDIGGETALALLEKYPTPDNIISADRADVITLISKVSRKNITWSTNKYNLIYEKAREFRPISISNIANITMIKNYIAIIRSLNKSVEDISKSIEVLITGESFKNTGIAENVRLLCTIPGISKMTAATIVAEVGDFSAFKNAKKLTAFFGIDPSVNQSGTFQCTKSHISKRGSRFLRRAIFASARACIIEQHSGKKVNPVLWEYYKAKCTSKPKMVALGAVMHKLVHIIFAVLRDKKGFELRTPEEHLKIIELRIQKQRSKTA